MHEVPSQPLTYAEKIRQRRLVLRVLSVMPPMPMMYVNGASLGLGFDRGTKDELQELHEVLESVVHELAHYVLVRGHVPPVNEPIESVENLVDAAYPEVSDQDQHELEASAVTCG